MFDNINPEFLDMLYRVPVLLLSFMTHELFHAFAAYQCGDMTAKQAGRISFNPLRHIDPIGAIMLITVRFGWAKPVPINPNNFRNKKSGIIITSLAGPLSNVLLSMIFYVIWGVYLGKAYRLIAVPGITVHTVIYNVLVQFVMVNLSLAAFNLIPIPPLDGSKVLFSFLPERILYNYVFKYERYGMFLLIALSYTSVLGKIINPIAMFLYSFFQNALDPLITLILSI